MSRKNLGNDEDRAYLSLEGLQEVTLELLKDFDAFCGEHGLTYALCGGTLLGAVRHGGFIPWDDDVDVMMLREDYERLLGLKGKARELGERDLLSNRDDTFARDFARFVRTDYGKSEEGTRDDDCPWVGLDVFPVDFLPDSDEEFARQLRDRQFWRQLCLTCASPFNTGTTFAKRWVRNLTRPFALAYGKYRIARKAEEVCMRFDGEPGDTIGAVCGEYGLRERWPLADFAPIRRIPFADSMLPVPAGYDVYLRNLYGANYMEVPPPEKRRPSHIRAYRIGRAPEAREADGTASDGR